MGPAEPSDAGQQSRSRPQPEQADAARICASELPVWNSTRTAPPAASLTGPETLDSVGLYRAMWITLLITLGGTVIAVALHALSGAGLPRPDLDRWVGKKGPAIPSPPLLALLRRRAP